MVTRTKILAVFYRNAFRQGLVQGEKPVIYPILQWLFQNMDDLKKRAYLARYLVRIDIPPDQLADQDISELNETVRRAFFTTAYKLILKSSMTLYCNIYNQGAGLISDCICMIRNI